MIIYFGIVTFIFGLLLGSFLNCTAMRICRKEDWVKGKSHCMHCGHDLSAKDLIPLFSYLSTKGRCRYCREKISKRYPLTELTFALLATFMYIAVLKEPLRGYFDEGADILVPLVVFIRNIFLTGCLFIIALVDLEIQEVPDGCLFAGGAAFFITSPLAYRYNGDGEYFYWLLFRVLAAIGTLAIILALVMLLEKFLHKDAMGGGDIKLFSLMALYLGYAGSYELVLLSCILGLIFAFVRKILYPDSAKELPFAPAIAASGFLLLIFSDAITNWYFGFL